MARLLKRDQVQAARIQARKTSGLESSREDWYEKMHVYNGLGVVRSNLDTSVPNGQWDYSRIVEAQKIIQTDVTQAHEFGNTCDKANFIPKFRDDDKI